VRLMRAHPIIAASLAVVLLTAAGAAAWSGVGYLGYRSFQTGMDALSRIRGGPQRPVVLAFAFRGRRCVVSATVDARYLAGARRAPTDGVFNSDASTRERCVRALVAREARGPFIGELAEGLRRCRDRLGLDSDGYVELMAAAVQQLTYGTPQWRIELPEVVVADHTGVCSDRSVLLASLLVHEGYDTCLWVFEREAHVAVGVRGLGHRTGYAFVETTRLSFVGDAGSIYEVARLAGWEPQLVRVGGTRRYRSDVLAAFVVRELAEDTSRSNTAPAYADYARTAGPNWRECYATMAAKHEVGSERTAWVRDHSDDLPMVYAMLTRSGLGR
jgi:hypothetical protein